MSDPSETHEQLIEAKLELIRQKMESGFSELKTLFSSHVAEDAAKDAAAHTSLHKLEDRVRSLEIEQATTLTKMRIMVLVLSLSSGGAGALISKLVV